MWGMDGAEHRFCDGVIEPEWKSRWRFLLNAKMKKNKKKYKKNEAIGAKWTDKNYRMLVPVVGLIDG